MNMDVSIIITAYNYEKYILECINSCIEQENTNLNFEVLVVDDGSTDNTERIMESIHYPNLKKYRIQNSGIEAASNFGFEKAEGKFIVRVDADDKLAKNYLSGLEPFISDEYGFFYSNYFQIDSNGSILNKVNLPPFDPEEIVGRGDFLATGTLYSKEILADIGNYSTKEKNTGLENFELMLKLIQKGVKGLHIPEYLFFYRRHFLNLSDVKRNQIIQNGIRMFQEMNLGTFRTNRNHPYGLVI